MWDWQRTRPMAMSLFSGNIFHMTRYPGLYHCKTKPLLCIDNANESNDAVIFKISNTRTNSAELDLKCLAVPASTAPPPLRSPCSIHGSAHHQSGIISEPLVVNSCKQYKNKNGFSFCPLATAAARAVREQACVECLREPPCTTPPNPCVLPRAGEACQACQVLLSSKPHHPHRKCPGQSVQQTSAPRPVWHASIFLA